MIILNKAGHKLKAIVSKNEADLFWNVYSNSIINKLNKILKILLFNHGDEKLR